MVKAKPAVAKGKYIKGCYLSSTMGPGVSIDTARGGSRGEVKTVGRLSTD